MKNCEKNRSALASKVLKMVAGGLLCGGLLVNNPVSAQPDGGPMGGGPMGNQQGGQGRGGNRQGGNRGDRSQMRDQMIRMQLERAGYTDATLQSAVIAALKAKEARRQPLYTAANELSQALPDEDVTDQEIATLYDTFNAALTTEKVKTKAAESELDKQIKFSADKRLSAVLTLAGIIGDATGYLSSPMGGGGMGGPGGGGPNRGMGGPGGMMGPDGGPMMPPPDDF